MIDLYKIIKVVVIYNKIKQIVLISDENFKIDFHTNYLIIINKMWI